MNEKMPGFKENIPSSENVKEVFEKLLGTQEYTETRKCEDEQGLYLWDVTIPQADGYAEYSYMRKGRHAQGGEASDTAIHVTFYDQDGFPVGGHSVAKYEDGEWVVTP